MFTEDYTVRIEQFEGPLDLLLHLIRRAELDVTAISVASITDQYLQHIRRLEHVDVDVAGDFLVTAATLLEVKSRLVSPPAPASEGDAPGASIEDLPVESDANPAAELIRQLLAYKAYRDAADALEARRREWSERFPASQAVADPGALEAFAPGSDLDLEDLGLYDLVEAFQRIIETVQFDRLGAHSVTFDDTPIELHAEDLLDRLRAEGAGPAGVTLRAVFAGRTRSEMIGLFLATLELVRQRRVVVAQDEDSGEIVLRPGEETVSDTTTA